MKSLDKVKKKTSVVERMRSVAMVTVPRVLISCGGYLIVGIFFIIFLIANRGIVLGDRDAHFSVFHPPQILYFGLFSFTFGFPWIATKENLIQFFDAIRSNKLKTTITTSAIFGSLYLSCHVHPYLLADNRHFTFYVWRRFLGCPTSPFSRSILLTPLYAFSLCTIISTLRTKDTLWRYFFSICLCISIVPQKLLEFRYFVVPFMIWRLNIPNNHQSNHFQLTVEFVLNCFVNILTIYLFLYKTFKWPSSTETQRFMWWNKILTKIDCFSILLTINLISVFNPIELFQYLIQ